MREVECMMKVSAVDYKIEVMKAPEDEGGFLAYVPQLKCWGDGDTVQEAMADVIAVANDLIEIAMEDGVRIPEPDKIKVDEEFSGKLSLRLPKYLHAEVAKRAERRRQQRFRRIPCGSGQLWVVRWMTSGYLRCSTNI